MELKSIQLAHRNSREDNHDTSFLFIIECISCFLILRECYLLGKEFQDTEIEEFSLKPGKEIFGINTTVV